MIKEWFEKRWPKAPTILMLPKIGFIVEDEIPLACGFLYLSGTSMSFLEFVSTNPETKSTRGLVAIDFMIEEIKKMLPQFGVTTMLQFLEDKFAKYYERKHDFVIAEKANLVIWNKER